MLYGNLGTGSVSTAGEFTVKGGVQEDGTLNGGSVYVDSDLTGTTGGINLSAGGEVLLDITNIAKANSKGEGDNGKDALHEFLSNYEEGGGNKIILNSANDDVIIAIDMWSDISNGFDLGQFDNKADTYYFDEAIKALGNDIASKTHIWISDADQLKGIQEYAENPLFPDTQILTYNFALKDNIDATALTDYKEIGGDDGFSGTFDGRGFRIIGLNADATSEQNASSGIFSTLSGTVKDLRVYASKFFGGANENAGVIAASNEGTITGVTTFGNRVEAEHAGGIAGTNAGKIESSAASDSVITNGGTAGGIAGTNTGTIGAEEGTFVTAESAVTSDGNATAIGGVVGDNKDTVNLANSLGVTNGEGVDKVGGIAGVNSGTMYSLYNESVVTGKDNVGGVAGTNSGNITNAVNTTGITATGDYAGGLAGVNSGAIDSGRNTGTINGTNNVGGMVGKNEEKADGTGGILKNLSNAVTAAIFGSTNVGGIAGTNSGTITSDNNLVNEGTVYGNQYVGGIAGVNELGGVIENVTSETLVLKTSRDDDAKYFGGIAGQNAGTITYATNESNVRAEGAEFVGGIAGENTETGWLTGSLVNNGYVTGLSNVGGLAGVNNNSSLLKGGADNPLRVTNNGTITATDGGAGGIFHTNTGNIEYAVLTNNGTIIATGGNANTGGLFGYNSGNITNSTLANSGEVNGGANTGGLIGYNTGTLTGGRGAGENGMTLYKYQIYNNGAVSGADNVGGLIGHNADGGALYAAYNTGTVTTTGNNAGGIVGMNAGEVSSVFNTIMTAIENGETKYGAVTGKTNVGGIVGINTGKLTNAYNTTAVESGGTKGNIAGSNSGEVENVYATNNDKNGMLIGTGNGTVTNGYNYDETKKDSASYEGFFKDGNDAWRIYEGYSTPLLRVFLTDAKYEGSSDQFTYNANMQGIKDLENVMAADGLNGLEISSIAEVLLTALEQKNAGENYLAFSSTQIVANNNEEGFNPNNLGYDIDATFDIKKALLSVNDVIAKIVYGGSKYEVTGGVLEGVIEGDSVDIDVDFADMSKEELDKLIVEGSEYDKSKGGRATADVLYGDDGKVAAYENSLLYNGSLSLTGNDADNYALAEDTTVGGSITVEKAKLNVELGTVERTYGNTDITTEGGYKVTDSFKQHLVNGDENLGYAVSDFNVTVAENGDTALTGVSTGRVTKDANLENESYYWTAEKVSGVNGETLTNLSKNYDIVDNGQGKSIVNKAPLSITLNDVTRIYGDAETFVDRIGYGIAQDGVDGLVNGDDEKRLTLSETYKPGVGDGTEFGDGALYYF